MQLVIIYNWSMRFGFSELSTSQRIFISAVGAFVIYGGWGYFVNSMHTHEVAMMVAYVQGSYSFAVTLVMTILIEAIYRLCKNLVNNLFLVNWFTILFCCSIVFSGSWWVNAMAGTPEIFETVILGYILGGIYTVVYVFALSKNTQK